jgi:hypothetical protein
LPGLTVETYWKWSGINASRCRAQPQPAWPVTRHDVLGLPGGVAGDEDYTADGLVADPSDAVLEEAVVAVGAGELVLLAVIQRADGDHD